MSCRQVGNICSLKQETMASQRIPVRPYVVFAACRWWLNATDLCFPPPYNNIIYGNILVGQYHDIKVRILPKITCSCFILLKLFCFGLLEASDVVTWRVKGFLFYLWSKPAVVTKAKHADKHPTFYVSSQKVRHVVSKIICRFVHGFMASISHLRTCSLCVFHFMSPLNYLPPHLYSSSFLLSPPPHCLLSFYPLFSFSPSFLSTPPPLLLCAMLYLGLWAQTASYARLAPILDLQCFYLRNWISWRKVWNYFLLPLDSGRVMNKGV